MRRCAAQRPACCEGAAVSKFAQAFLRSITLDRARVEKPDAYPFSIPALRAFESLEFDRAVTFLVGENGSGKSTLIEAIAIAAGFNAEGGSINFNFATRPSESGLHEALKLVRGLKRPKTGYFLRAESFFNVATELDRIADADILRAYGGKSLHEQSHGESFLALVNNRFGPNGLYILDEPEAALSPQRQLSLLTAMHRLVKQGSQFVIATHSPILLAFPEATIHVLTDEGLTQTAYEATEHFSITRDFLQNYRRFLKQLFADDAD